MCVYYILIIKKDLSNNITMPLDHSYIYLNIKIILMVYFFIFLFFMVDYVINYIFNFINKIKNNNNNGFSEDPDDPKNDENLKKNNTITNEFSIVDEDEEYDLNYQDKIELVQNIGMFLLVMGVCIFLGYTLYTTLDKAITDALTIELPVKPIEQVKPVLEESERLINEFTSPLMEHLVARTEPDDREIFDTYIKNILNQSNSIDSRLSGLIFHDSSPALKDYLLNQLYGNDLYVANLTDMAYTNVRIGLSASKDLFATLPRELQYLVNDLVHSFPSSDLDINNYSGTLNGPNTFVNFFYLKLFAIYDISYREIFTMVLKLMVTLSTGLVSETKSIVGFLVTIGVSPSGVLILTKKSETFLSVYSDLLEAYLEAANSNEQETIRYALYRLVGEHFIVFVTATLENYQVQ